MAILVNTTTGQRIMIPARAILGRSRNCTLMLNDPCVSSEHATLSWTRDGWEVHDLGSRNGTYIDGRRLQTGDTSTLERGSTVSFGDPTKQWQLEDDSIPEACARDCNSNLLLFAQKGLLVLPEPHRPIVTIFCDPRHGWIAEVNGEPRNVEDGHLIAEAGMAWQLHLPMMQETTQEFSSGKLYLNLLNLHFRIADAEDFIELSVSYNDRVVLKRSRAFNQLLLTLARRRLADAESGHKHRDDQGWIYVDEICRDVGIDENRLAVDIHRARREFAAENIINAANIIERRRTTRQVRLGASNISIEDSRLNPA